MVSIETQITIRAREAYFKRLYEAKTTIPEEKRFRSFGEHDYFSLSGSVNQA